MLTTTATTPATIARTFLVPDENLGSLRLAFAKLAKRAARIGCPVPTLTIDPTPRDVVQSVPLAPGTGRVYRSWPVTVTGEAPRYQGWRFVAALQHVTQDDGAEATVLRVLDSDTPIPAHYREASQVCDHCKAHRRRHATYLVAHDTGAFKQVGSTCIRDFLGHDSPDSLAAAAELLADAFEHAYPVCCQSFLRCAPPIAAVVSAA